MSTKANVRMDKRISTEAAVTVSRADQGLRAAMQELEGSGELPASDSIPPELLTSPFRLFPKPLLCQTDDLTLVAQWGLAEYGRIAEDGRRVTRTAARGAHRTASSGTA